MIRYPDFLSEYRQLLHAFRRAEPQDEHLHARHAALDGLSDDDARRVIRSLMGETTYPSRAAWMGAIREVRKNRPPAFRPPADTHFEPARLEYAKFRWKLIMLTLAGEASAQRIAEELRAGMAEHPEIELGEVERWEARRPFRTPARPERENPKPIYQAAAEAVHNLFEQIERAQQAAERMEAE